MTEPERVAGLAVYERGAVGGGGTAPRVVFVHGAMDRGASFAKVSRYLPDLELVRYDRRGYGRSHGAGVASTVEAHAQDLLAVIGSRPSAVVGHSFGGVVVLTAATLRPDLVRAALAFEPPMPWKPWWPAGSAGGEATAAAEAAGPGAAAERFMRRVVGDAVWESLPPSTQEARRSEGGALLAELAAMRALDAEPYDLAALGGRVLVGHGSDTDERHVRAATEIAQAASVRVSVIDGARHGAHVSHPEAFAELVRRAVAMASGASSVPTDA